MTDVIVGDDTKDLVELEVAGETITATDGHPFWVSDEAAWVDAGNLEPGDRLLLVDGSTVELDGIRDYQISAVVHNLTVDGQAGKAAVLVHNCGVSSGEGGRFVDLDARSVVGDQLTPHHMPQTALGFTSRAEGGALVLPHALHMLTKTYGARDALTKVQDAGLSFRQALALDIVDVRRSPVGNSMKAYVTCFSTIVPTSLT